MAGANIWIVEDDRDILELVQYQFQRDGYRTRAMTTLAEARKRMARGLPDLLLLDLMLPDGNGLDFCRELRSQDRTRALPIVVMTARDDDIDIVAGLELGADDYVTKPFSPRILLARARAVLRRHAAGDSEAEQVNRGPLQIDRDRHIVAFDGHPLDLTRGEFDLLALLARRPGVVYSRERIVDALHGSDYAVTDRSVDVQVAGLRRKLGEGSRLIETVRGVGYRFSPTIDM